MNGAGVVVTKDVPETVTDVGNPAMNTFLHHNRQKLIICAVALIIALIIGELVVRFLGYSPYKPTFSSHSWAAPDPVLGWINNAGVHFSNESDSAPMTFWNRGRRATQQKLPTKSDYEKKRIVVFGGSFTQGYGVIDSETFPWILNSQYDDILVENYGTGGYGTYQSLLAIERCFKTSDKVPVLVIYGFCYFHGTRNVQNYAHLRGLRNSGGERFVSPGILLRKDDSIERVPPFSIKDWPLEKQIALVSLIHDCYYRVLLWGNEKQFEASTKKLLGEMNRLVKNNDSKLLVAILDNIANRAPYMEFMQDNSIECIDCTYPDNNWWENEQLRNGKLGHPNVIMHTYWAKCIKDWIDKTSP